MAHQGASFSVVTKNQEVSVLGTEFNIKAQTDDRVIATTLVEGGVEIIVKDGERKRLDPGQQSRIGKESGAIDVQIVEVSQEISWRRGLFWFEDESLENIMKTLARWYDVDVVFESADHKDFLASGILERSSDVENILGHLEASSEGEIVFEINGKMIVIK